MTTERFRPDSTNIAEVAYDAAAKSLEVQFADGGQAYTYQNVPPDVFSAFKQAPSAGSFFHRQVRGRYPYRRA